MRHHTSMIPSFVFLAAMLLPASFASAQWAPVTQPDAPGAAVAPTPPPAPPEMVQAPPVRVAQPPPKKGLEVGFTWSLQIGVPIFLDFDRDVVRPGADISFFGAADFDWFSIGGNFGIGWNPINLNGQVIDGIILSGRSPLTRIFLSLPEFRFQIPDLKVVMPYISGAFDMNWWNFRETEIGCGFWYCSQFSVYRFTPGFTGRVGFGFQVKRGIFIDVGLRYSMSGKGDFFPQREWWLTPYAGIMLRRRK